MSLPFEFQVEVGDFNSSYLKELAVKRYARDQWPLVYILSDGREKQAYVGETTDVLSRMDVHQKHARKQSLTTVHLIWSDYFNKSAALDIESSLIQYMSADGVFKLMNGNLGIANHTYYQKAEYWQTFTFIWDKLLAEGLAKHSLKVIDNSDVFKYSPYKALSKEQSLGLLNILKVLANDTGDNIIVRGGAGTGKSILAIFIFKLLKAPISNLDYQEFGEFEQEVVKLVTTIKSRYKNLHMGLVVPMTSFRKTLKKIFKGIGGLTASMVIGPSETAKRPYDILIVDEAHRLRKRKGLTSFGAYDAVNKRLGLGKYKHTELDWVLKQSQKAVFFYDVGQSIRPSDVDTEDFDRLKSQKTTVVQTLKSQMRCRGGNGYINFVDNLLRNGSKRNLTAFENSNYDLKLFTSLKAMIEATSENESNYGLSRLVAGFSWRWVSKDQTKDYYAPYDIYEDGVSLKWNSTNEDWINSPGAIDEAGCIHTTQGYDLNYVSVIFGYEIGYNSNTEEIVFWKDRYKDPKGKSGVEDEELLKNYVLNIYRTIMQRGILGAYVYVCDPALREYMSRYIPLAISETPIEKPIIPLPAHRVVPFENSVPLYSMKAAAGGFGPVEAVEEEDWITVPSRYTLDTDCFACRVVGESMNQVIPNGSICLFRRYKGGSRSGKIFLVELNAFTDAEAGSAYTVKEYRSKKVHNDENWGHRSISLHPRSHGSSFQPLELTEESASEMRVIGEFTAVLGK
ncbi:hypothetical protein GGR28_001796 [Lewinella aquimaris]|uniref:GIY-YIG domain-containing protein n=1 Tax=Neolewinella aquimaris TaxID=1835722 RepID=A0A840EE10_9BACT|nr:DNA/RNA helicase domain-containing protein [Neolewinella aquimaris]MBB4079176.1 hypothetical protein [Neolewinella aquimaris]